jgi:hypothetical protein
MTVSDFRHRVPTDRIRLVKPHLDFLDYHSWNVNFVWVSGPRPSSDSAHPFCLSNLVFTYEVMLCNLEFASLVCSC